MTRFNFRKQESNRYKRVSATYRRPRGFHSKMREHRKGNLRLPEAGFRAPVEIRGFHPCGLQETLVFNESMLTSVNPKLYAIRISATVAHPKKMKIADGAKKLGLKILNPPKARPKREKKTKTEKPKAEETRKPETFIKAGEAEKQSHEATKPKTVSEAPKEHHEHTAPTHPVKQKKVASVISGGTEK